MVDAHATALSGVAVRVTPSLGTDAIVIGSIGPAFRALSSQQVLRFSSASATNLAS